MKKSLSKVLVIEDDHAIRKLIRVMLGEVSDDVMEMLTLNKEDVVSFEGELILAHPLEHIARLEDLLLIGMFVDYHVAQAGFRSRAVSFSEIEIGEFEDLLDICLSQRRFPFQAGDLPALFPYLAPRELEKLLPAQAHSQPPEENPIDAYSRQQARTVRLTCQVSLRLNFMGKTDEVRNFRRSEIE